MGIPFYFKNTIGRFPCIVNPCSKARPETCNWLFLDYNCVIHGVAGKLAAEPSVKTQPIHPDAFQDIVIKQSLNYIDELLHYVAPTDGLYISVDGTCPRAKMHQQRKRRYMSVWRRDMLMAKGIVDEGIWDSNIVTPGSLFMKKFDSALAAYVDHLVRIVPNGCKVLYSDSSKFGEGEHKIFNYMRDTMGDPSLAEKIVIYGLDADLILLSLLNVCDGTQIRLLREAPEFKVKSQHREEREAFLLLDVNSLFDKIIISHFDDPSKNKESSMRDYVMLCSLIGNDFLPPLSYLKIKHNGLETIISTYTQISSKLGGSYLCDDNHMDLIFLERLLEQLASDEDGATNAAHKQINRKPISPHFKTSRERAEWELDNYPSLFRQSHNIDAESKAWRLSYYKILFGDNSHHSINTVCKGYIEGLLWVHKYYMRKNFNRGWYYKYNYSPSALDLQRYLTSLADEGVSGMTHCATHPTNDEFVKAVEMSDDVHMMLVLPPQSAHIAGSRMGVACRELSSGLVHLFPREFQICTYMKSYMWECSPLLPDIDLTYFVECLNGTPANI